MALPDEVLHIDVLTEVCGFFDGRADTNNGYGCKHPDCESRDDENGLGQCFTFSCPVAVHMVPDQEEEDRNLLVDAGALEPTDPTRGCENYMLVYDQAVLGRLAGEPTPAPGAGEQRKGGGGA